MAKIYKYTKDGVEKQKTVQPDQEAAFLAECKEKNIVPILVSDESGKIEDSSVDAVVESNQNASTIDTESDSDDGSLESQEIKFDFTTTIGSFYGMPVTAKTTKEDYANHTLAMYEAYLEVKDKSESELTDYEKELKAFGEENLGHMDITGLKPEEWGKLDIYTMELDEITDKINAEHP